MNAVFIVLIIFGMPFGTAVAIVAIRRYYDALEKGLIGPNAKTKNAELATLRDDKKRLEARIQNLESIVCSVDFELNQKLNHVAAQQLNHRLAAAGGAPAPAPVSPTTVGRSPTLQSSGLRAGTQIAARYTVERELGRGGMGAVYLANDAKLGERVALKIVSPVFASDPGEAAERFRREVSTARKITHPNVIRIHDLVEDGENLLLSMEYIDGMSLAAYLVRNGMLAVPEARHLLIQICQGLEAAHAMGTIHRDLKPGNVLIDHSVGANKQVKLIDFGLARSTYLQGMTATGLILGTPEYMAPEQVRGLPCDARTDVYSLGCVAYHVLTGRAPFSGDSPIAIGFLQVTEPPRPPRSLRADLPETLEAAVLRALAKDPASRFASVAEFRGAIGAASTPATFRGDA